jgi:hypothetical protein
MYRQQSRELKGFCAANSVTRFLQRFKLFFTCLSPAGNARFFNLSGSNEVVRAGEAA